MAIFLVQLLPLVYMACLVLKGYIGSYRNRNEG